MDIDNFDTRTERANIAAEDLLWRMRTAIQRLDALIAEFPLSHDKARLTAKRDGVAAVLEWAENAKMSPVETFVMIRDADTLPDTNITPAGRAHPDGWVEGLLLPVDYARGYSI